jgi:hypothetical protein
VLQQPGGDAVTADVAAGEFRDRTAGQAGPVRQQDDRAGFGPAEVRRVVALVRPSDMVRHHQGVAVAARHRIGERDHPAYTAAGREPEHPGEEPRHLVECPDCA